MNSILNDYRNEKPHTETRIPIGSDTKGFPKKSQAYSLVAQLLLDEVREATERYSRDALRGASSEFATNATTKLANNSCARLDLSNLKEV